MASTFLKKINPFRKPFPVRLQFDKSDCGATCVKIVLEHFGQHISSTYIKDVCFTDLQGANIRDVENALQHFGFRTSAVRGDMASISSLKALPAILLIEDSHYIVLYKVSEKYFYISDPEFGKYKLSRELFEKRWLQDGSEKGVAILFEYSGNVEIDKQAYIEPNLQKTFFESYIKGNMRMFSFVLVMSALMALTNLAFPVLTKKIVDEAIPQNNYTLMAAIVLSQIVIILAGSIFNFIKEKAFIKVTSRLNITALSRFLYKLSRIPFKFFELKNVPDIVQRIGDHIRIETFVTNNIASTIYSLINVFAFSVLLLQYNPLIFVTFSVSVIASLLWTLSYTHKRNLIEYKRFSSYKSGMGSSYEIVQGMVELKLNNAEDYRIREWRTKQERIFKTKEEALVLESTIHIGNTLISQLKNAVITFFSAYLVMNNSLTLGEMLSISYIIGVLSSPLGTFLEFLKKWNETKFSFSRINEVNEMDDEDDAEAVSDFSASQFHEISLQHVNFRYNPNAKKNILNDVSMKIRKGQKIAFVGKSGSGKTTLMKLLLKFYNPSEGNIYIDGVDFTALKAKDWRNLCGTVMHSGYIFMGSILDNIVLDKTSVDTERLHHVCKLANVSEFVSQLPKKYDTIMGQNGIGMSGGQIQRILIARALYKDPEILIFDEATSSLDTYNENQIMNNIYKYSQSKTMITIAHRLSTIKNSDVIYVFDKGRIVEYGQHHELVALKKKYYKLIKNQLEVTV